MPAARGPQPTAHAPSLDIGAHFPALDGLRGLAILLVLIFHETVMVPNTAFDRAFLHVAYLGWCGVDLFFVLSGFLITGILFDTKGTENFFRNFYARRTLRIFPLYYAVVFFSLIILPAVGQMGLVPPEKFANFGRIEGNEIWYWLYLSNFSIANEGRFLHAILDISWSLAIEEQFYLLWPTVVYFCSRRALMRVCIGLVFLAIAWRTSLVFGFSRGPFVNPIGVYVMTPGRLDALAIGAWIALAVRVPGGIERTVAMARKTMPLAAFGVVAFVALDNMRRWFPPDFVDHRDAHSFAGHLMQCVGYTVFALFFAALLVLTLTAPAGTALGRFFHWRFMRMLGQYSYAMYLFHLPIRALIRDRVFGPGTASISPRFHFPTIMGSELPGQLLFYAVSTAATLVLAWLSWHCFEKHFLKLKRFFPAKRRRAGTPAPAGASWQAGAAPPGDPGPQSQPHQPRTSSTPVA